MILKKGKLFGQYNDGRHERDLKLQKKFKSMKEEELQKIKDERDKAQQTFMSMTELQQKITDQNRYLVEIESMHSDLQFLQLQMKEYEDCIEYLDEKRELLD